MLVGSAPARAAPTETLHATDRSLAPFFPPRVAEATAQEPNPRTGQRLWRISSEPGEAQEAQAPGEDAGEAPAAGGAVAPTRKPVGKSKKASDMGPVRAAWETGSPNGESRGLSGALHPLPAPTGTARPGDTPAWLTRRVEQEPGTSPRSPLPTGTPSCGAPIRRKGTADPHSGGRGVWAGSSGPWASPRTGGGRPPPTSAPARPGGTRPPPPHPRPGPIPETPRAPPGPRYEPRTPPVPRRPARPSRRGPPSTQTAAQPNPPGAGGIKRGFSQSVKRNRAEGTPLPLGRANGKGGRGSAPHPASENQSAAESGRMGSRLASRGEESGQWPGEESREEGGD